MHDVTALIAKSDKLTAVTRRFKTVALCPLDQGFALVPITEEFEKEIAGYASQAKVSIVKIIDELSDDLQALALEISHECPVAYVSTCYFGGQGSQNALVWDKGSLRFSPTTPRYNEAWPNSPISQALRAIGVVAAEGMDEFDTVSLGKHRHTHKWAESVK